MHNGIGRIRMLLRLTVLLCGAYLIWYGADGYRQKKLEAELSETVRQEREVSAGPAVLEPEQKNAPAPDASFRQTERELLPEFARLKLENDDLAGWLTIPGTKIDYPVMRGEDDEYYLDHDFYGEKSRHGSLFVKKRVDTAQPGANFIIYGHNMKDGTMFGDLDDYRDEEYCGRHPEIQFCDLYVRRVYRVMAAFEAKVYEEGEEGLRYYEFYEAASEEEFNQFCGRVMENALYDTGVTAEYGDALLTLSTCAYHTEDGRFVVVAKQIE